MTPSYARGVAEGDDIALGVLGLGTERGDRSGIWSPNSAERVLVHYATARTGAILVNVNPAYRWTELEHVLGHSGYCSLLAAPSFKTSDYPAMDDEVAPRLPLLDDEEVRACCKGRVAHCKVSRYVRVVDEYPLTVTGKVQKLRLREMAVAALEHSR